MKLLITGGTGFTGDFLLNHLAESNLETNSTLLVRENSKIEFVKNLNIHPDFIIGDSSIINTWQQILNQESFDVIVHIASIRHTPIILKALEKLQQNPRLIIVGTTGVYSQYNHYSATYKEIEKQLANYNGKYCLLRPTMIYGSHRDKNLHKLIKFCNQYGFFFVFGEGKSLLQPVHADDLAQAILNVLQNPDIQGVYDLSGGTVVNFSELLDLIEKILDKPILKLKFPLQLGIWSATILETILGKRSPVRREQILRLQEDKAYPNDKAKQELNFNPRSLEVGLKQEVEILRQKNLI